MNTLSKLSLAAALIVISTQAHATCNINGRQALQDWRIFKGVVHNNLTFSEFKKLQRGQHRLQRLENLARANGNISAAECFVLNQAMNYQSGRIWRKKHN